MKKQGKTYHFVYKITNLVNQKIYVGKHSTLNFKDDYLGSSKHLNNSIKKYGKENFKREILKFFDTDQEAYEYEAEIVDKEFVLREDTYNYKLGGSGGFSGMVSVVDRDGNYSSVFKDDPRYLSGELVGVTTGYTMVILEDGAIQSITNEEFHKNPEKYRGIATGRITVQDKNGVTSSVTKENKDYLSGALTSLMLGYSQYYYQGRIQKLAVDSQFVLSGEAIHIFTGYVSAKNKDGISISIPQEEFDNNSDLVGVLSRRVSVRDKYGNTFSVSISDPRYLSGELVHVLTGGNSPLKGKTCITNGLKDTYIDLETEEIPVGYWVGSQQKGNTRITNGEINRTIDLNAERIPLGWYKGINTKGKTGVTNGKIDLILNLEIEEIPKGFWIGSRTKGKVEYTDGKVNKYFFKNDQIPEGFTQGATVKAFERTNPKWKLTSPIGEVFLLKTSLRKFCKEKRISISILIKYLGFFVKTSINRDHIGNRKNTIGWRLEKLF